MPVYIKQHSPLVIWSLLQPLQISWWFVDLKKNQHGILLAIDTTIM
jgi:hypothetical protein